MLKTAQFLLFLTFWSQKGAQGAVSRPQKHLCKKKKKKKKGAHILDMGAHIRIWAPISKIWALFPDMGALKYVKYGRDMGGYGRLFCPYPPIWAIWAPILPISCFLGCPY